MRIYAVTPIHVDPEELARRQARYDALSPAGLSVTLHDVGDGAPRALETPEDIRASEVQVIEALEQAPDVFDALMPDCVLDPGVEILTRTSARPVLGLLRISLGWNVCTGRTSGAVARNKAIADEIVQRVEVYGWSSAFTSVEILDLDIDAVAEGTAWTAALEAAQQRIGRLGASAVVNGCSAVDLPPQAADSHPRIVDPTALALRLIAAAEAA